MAIPTEKPSFGVLDDVKVVFAAMEEAVPRACNIMADWGADVTWLENTGYGDTVRDAKNAAQAERRNCRSVALNQFTPEGKEVLLKMLADTDIFFESSKGGTWQRKGITDWAMYEGIMYMSQYYLVDYLNDGVKWPRAGARNQNLCGIGVYKCADGFIALNLFGIRQNKWMLETLGMGDVWGSPEVPDDTASLWLSIPIAPEFEKRLEKWLSERTKLELEDVLAEQGIAAQSVYEFEDMVADEHMKMRGNFIEWETKDGDTFKGLSPMPRFEQTPGQVWRPMPEQGGDTIDVLTKLGYTPEQIDELIAANVVKAG